MTVQDDFAERFVRPILVTDTASRMLIALLLIWITFFGADYEHSIWSFVGYVLLILVALIPTFYVPVVGPVVLLPMMPILWGWWWMGSISAISSLTWIICGCVFAVRVVLLFWYLIYEGLAEKQ